ncbi:MAG: hypothetical protein P8Y97_13040 [Candidatus Lokiarchaeota archaeon]
MIVTILPSYMKPFDSIIIILFYKILGFLGLIYIPVIPNVGYIYRRGVPEIPTAPWATIWPGIAKFGLIFPFFLLYESLRILLGLEFNIDQKLK